MMEAGLMAEVQSLRDSGVDGRYPAMSGLGYRQLLSYLAGETTLDEAVERIKFETHRFARQQNTWFRLDDPQINWFDMAEVNVETAVASFVSDWLHRGKT
jgi:tRNA dimethylallyltransferase